MIQKEKKLLCRTPEEIDKKGSLKEWGPKKQPTQNIFQLNTDLLTE